MHVHLLFLPTDVNIETDPLRKTELCSLGHNMMYGYSKVQYAVEETSV